MATLTCVTNNGPVKTASTWSPAEEPKSTDELVIPTGKTVEMATAATVLSLKTEGTGTLSGNKPLTLGGSGNSLNLSASTVLGASTKIVLSPAGGVTTEPITNGVDVKTITFAGTATSKHKLGEAITASTELAIKAGIFKSEGFNLTLGKFVWESATAKEIVLGTSVVKMSSSEPFIAGSTPPTLSIASSLWEFTATESTFSGSGLSGNQSLKFTGKKVIFNETCQITNVELLLTGSGRTVELSSAASITVKVLGTITKSTGTILLKRIGAGSVHIEKTSGTVELARLEVENITAEGGATFKLVNAINLGGNSGFTWEAAPGTLAATLKLSGKATPQTSIMPILASTLKLSGQANPNLTIKPAVKANPVFSAGAPLSLATTPSIAGKVQFTPSAATKLQLAPELEGRLRFPSNVTPTKALALGTIASKIVFSGQLEPHTNSAVHPSVEGQVRFSASIKPTLNIQQTVAGAISFTGKAQPHLTVLRAISAVLGFAPSATAQTSLEPQVSATLRFSPSAQRTFGYTPSLKAAIAFSGTITPRVIEPSKPVTLTVTIGPSVSLEDSLTPSVDLEVGIGS
jgi:hypothetical protein